VLEFALALRRGHFQLKTEARFSSSWTVVFGPSGAGKSTILRLLAGLDEPDQGRVAFRGETWTDTGRGLRRRLGNRNIGLVSQQPALFPHMSVAANVRYGLAGLGQHQQTERAQEMLSLVGAADLADRRPCDLSGGEAQRIALARTLAVLPRLLLLDEPFSALDGTASDGLLSRLQPWLLERRIQTILVTHDATDAYVSNAEVALLCEGRIVAIGSAAEVLAGERQRILSHLGGD